MSIFKTITWNYEFADWIKKSDSYSNNFTFEGANALQEYLDGLSNELDEDMEFDPIAWCCEYSEYKSYKDAYDNIGDGTITDLDEIKEYIDDNTMTYEFDGGIIVQDF